MPPRDFYPAFSLFAQSRWQSAWEEQRRSKVKQLKPIIRPLLSAPRKNRQEEVILCRLRIGHTYATHGHILKGEDKPSVLSVALLLRWSVSYCRVLKLP